MKTRTTISRRDFLAAAGLTTLGAGWHCRRAPAQTKNVGTGLKAGVSSVCITPERPIWMAGFGARKKRSEGKYQDLFVKALALQDNPGQRVVIITSDLVAVTDNWAAPVWQRAKERFGLEPAEVLINCSHTHCGPVIKKSFYPEWDPQYTSELVDKTLDSIKRALADLEEARLERGRGSCTLSVNRRRPLPNDPKRVDAGLLPNPQGLTDHDVPVLKVSRADGSIKAVMFLYACHPTTMGGYLLGGDYAGFAQQFVEKEIPRATALFVQGCGGDLKPRNVDARGRFRDGPLENVAGFGRELSQAVLTVLAGKMAATQGPIQARRAMVDLPAQPVPSREELEARTKLKDYHGEWAKITLTALRENKPLRMSLPEIVQVVTIGDDFTVVALSGEACVDYALRIKRELGRDVWIAGYSNDVSAYIPSARMIPEGGYEVERSLSGGSQPTPFQPAIEEMIIAKVHELARARPSGRQ
jgi:hypothetical protein